MRVTVVVAVACLSLGGIAAATDAKAAFKQQTNIPAQGLGPALKALAKERNLQLVYAADEVGLLRTPGAVGQLTADQALTELLGGTGLTYRYLDDKTIAVQPITPVVPRRGEGEAHGAPIPSTLSTEVVSEGTRAGAKGSGSNEGTEGKRFWDQFRLAQVGQGKVSRDVPVANDKGSNSELAGTGLDEIIVTAQRRDERLRDVPVSIAAYDQTDFTRLAISGVEDIGRLTPGLTISTNGGYGSDVSIRGVASGGYATTGIYLDDTPIQVRAIGAGQTATTAYPTVFDLERVEILRGPQGTLFGAGSEGGAVRFITPAPSLTAYSGHIRAEYGFNGLGAPSYQIGAAVGGPLSDTLAFRVSAYTQEDGGWIDRRPYPLTFVTDKNINWTRTTTLNAALAWHITDNLIVTPKIFFQNQTDGGPPNYWRGLSNPSQDDFVVGVLTNRPALDQFSLPSLNVEWRANNITLISNTSYMNRTRTLNDDNTFFITQLLTGNFTSPNAFTPDFSQNPQRQFTQEIRLQSADANSRLRWVMGAFYQTLDESAFFATVGPGLQALYGVVPLPGGVVYIGNDETRDTQKAAFGQVDIRLFDKLTVTGGLRYSKMSYSYTNAQDGPFNGGPTGSAGGSSSSASTPKFGLDYKATEGLMFYASAAKGFRPGAANAPIASSLCAPDIERFGVPPVSYGPDSVWSYEAGSKGKLLENRFQWDASVYHIKWRNVQTTLALPSCGFTYTTDVGEAISKGFDLQMKYAVSEHLIIEGSLGYDNAKFSTTVPNLGAGALNITTKGELLPTSPWHGFASADYEFTPLANKTRVYLHMDDSYTDSYTLRSPQDAADDPANDIRGAVNSLSARIGIRGESWDAALFTKNLLNAHPLLFTVRDVPTSDLFKDQTVPPRVVGFTVTYRF